MKTKVVVFLFVILASCTPSPLTKGTETLDVTINHETPIPTSVACPPSQLIYDLHAPENVEELIGQYFSHPIPPNMLQEVRFRLMRGLSHSSNYVLARIDILERSTVVLGNEVCHGNYSQSSSSTYGFYQIKSVILLPDGNENEGLNLTCVADGIFDGNVAGWGYYEPNVNEMKRPQFAWRVSELTETFEEIKTDNIECQFNGGW